MTASLLKRFCRTSRTLPDPPPWGEGDRRRSRWWRGVPLRSNADTPPSFATRMPPPLRGRIFKYLPGTGRGTATAQPAWWRGRELRSWRWLVRERFRPLHHRLRRRSPSPHGGGSLRWTQLHPRWRMRACAGEGNTRTGRPALVVCLARQAWLVASPAVRGVGGSGCSHALPYVG